MHSTITSETELNEYNELCAFAAANETELVAQPLPASLRAAVIQTKTGAVALTDLVRKLYDVGAQRFDNSEAARSASLATGLPVAVVAITAQPKNAFWALWRSAPGKRALQAAGVYVTKSGEQFVVSASKASNTFWRRARSFDSMSSEERGYYDAALKDAIRDGDGAGSQSEKANLRKLRESFGLAPSPKYAASR